MQLEHARMKLEFRRNLPECLQLIWSGDQQLQQQQRRRETTIASRDGENNCIIVIRDFQGSFSSSSAQNTKAASAKLLIRGLVETDFTYNQLIHKTSEACKDTHNSWPG